LKIHHRDLEQTGRTACGKRYGKGLLIESARITKSIPVVAVRESNCMDCWRSLARDARLSNVARAEARRRLRQGGDDSLEFAKRTSFGRPKKPLVPPTKKQRPWVCKSRYWY
jgi:hypothetical protein